jgi:DNA polymerase/3'-5' exonuclease PolX
LAEVASLLEMQGANPYRVSAYRRAAATLLDLRRPAGEMLDELEELPGIGERLAAAIREIATTGRYPLLEHLRGEVDAVKVLQSAPGIGRVQAERLHRELGIDTLEDLEAAAHDGRLELVMGFGSKRVAPEPRPTARSSPIATRSVSVV